MIAINPDPVFKTYLMQRRSLTHAQFMANWWRACGWLAQWRINFNDPKAHAALQLYTQYLSATRQESAQAYKFCAYEFQMQLL